jgi:hypothetical protein
MGIVTSSALRSLWIASRLIFALLPRDDHCRHFARCDAPGSVWTAGFKGQEASAPSGLRAFIHPMG